MRRDVYLENDSGGFSVVSASAVDAVIEDGRADDLALVLAHQVLLLMLQGDDSLIVRVVADEPLSADEEAQWLARASGRIDAPDGRVLVMGGFDPDVLQWWKDEHAPDDDGRGVGVALVPPGSWRVDVYAHAGSMNGRHVLFEADERPGAAFRCSHPGRPFPTWLAHALDHSGDDDPGHEQEWRDLPGSVASGALAVAAEPASFVGLLVHLSRFDGADVEPPDGGWHDAEEGARVPETFPAGLPSDAIDPEMEGFLDRALGREKPKALIPVATSMRHIVECWPGDTLKKLDGGGAIMLAPGQAFLLHWMIALGSDSPPHFEYLVTDAAAWQPPQATAELAVVGKGRGAFALGPPANAGGWFTWWAARLAAAGLGSLPAGATLDVATRRMDAGDDETVGLSLWSGPVAADGWRIEESSPPVARAILEDAIGFVRRLVEQGSLVVTGDAERRAFEAAAETFAPGEGDLAWDGAVVRPTDGDERTLLLLAEPVFRTRFAGAWPMSPVDESDE